MVSLLKKLQELHTNGPAPYNHGIYTQVNGITHLERGYMLHLMQQWPERSGHIDLPVPASRADKVLNLLSTSIWQVTQRRCGTATPSMVSCVGNYWSG